jgi:hypothetical protein
MRVTLLHHTYIQNTSWFIHPTLATQKCCQIQHAVLRTHPHMRTERRPERRPGSHALGGRRRDAHDGAMPDATWHAFERWEPLVRCGRGSVMAPLISLLECPHQVVVDADGPCTERNGRPLLNVTAGRYGTKRPAVTERNGRPAQLPHHDLPRGDRMTPSPTRSSTRAAAPARRGPKHERPCMGAVVGVGHGRWPREMALTMALTSAPATALKRASRRPCRASPTPPPPRLKTWESACPFLGCRHP